MNDAARILIVDDDALIRLQLVQALRQQGYETAEAGDGEEALGLLRAQPFDLIVLDILMPRLDGFGVLTRMREKEILDDTPVVVISSLDDMDGIVRCIRMGAEDYLLKPFERTLLDARIQASLEKKRLREAVVEQLGRYVPEAVATSIIRDHRTLEPKRTLATILFADIEEFTRISEGLSPENVVTMLNEYFPAIVEPVIRHGGVVNQFQGDAVLVTFNIPLPDPNHADNAVKASQDIQQIVSERTFAGVRLRTRIGINTGQVVAGNVGSDSRYSYTVHGDAVNSAARLEQLNKELGTYTLISATTKALLQHDYGLRSLGTVPIRGKQDGLGIYTLGQPPCEPTLESRE